MVFGGMRFGAALLALGLWPASAPTQADEPSEHIVAVRGDVELMLMEGRTDELDAIADDYGASRVRVQGGWWALAQLYDWLTPFAGSGCGCGPDISRVTFDHKRKALEAWLERRPHSLTARIALANLWKSRAWQLRGIGYAKDTTAAAWRGFREAMARAEETLAPVEETADPMVYFLEMNMVAASDDPRGRLQSLYAARDGGLSDLSRLRDAVLLLHVRTMVWRAGRGRGFRRLPASQARRRPRQDRLCLGRGEGGDSLGRS